MGLLDDYGIRKIGENCTNTNTSSCTNNTLAGNATLSTNSTFNNSTNSTTSDFNFVLERYLLGALPLLLICIVLFICICFRKKLKKIPVFAAIWKKIKCFGGNANLPDGTDLAEMENLNGGNNVIHE